jgi:hypothetical protein
MAITRRGMAENKETVEREETVVAVVELTEQD